MIGFAPRREGQDWPLWCGIVAEWLKGGSLESGFGVANIRVNYLSVLERIDQSARRVGRDPEQVRLVVVTKIHPLATVEAVIAAGARFLGENYAEEAIPKIQAMSAQGKEWHMIGHVQSRKADWYVSTLIGCTR
jgi:uncharacterized pyridoxal phosphate-containing UPF0001 family protein